jgi:hypothetical protein
MQTDRLDVLWKERAITQVITRFGRSLDTGDRDLYMACFPEQVNLDFQRLTGHAEVRISAELLKRWADLFLSPTRRHHSYSNFDITLDGDRAHAKVYFTARHWKATDFGDSSNTQYGWYDFWLVKAGEDWKIRRFRHDFQWIDGNHGLFDLTEPELVAVMAQIFTDENKQSAAAAVRGWEQPA